MRISFIVGLSLACALPCFADLKFDAETVELKASPSDEVLAAEFTFKNTGDEPVDITEVKTGCSCLSGKTDKKKYTPGESGKLEAEFKIGRFTGYQKKSLTVVAGDKESEVYVGVQIPNVISITPNVMEWEVGEKPEKKVFKIIVEHPDPIGITSVSCTRVEDFDYELKTLKEGREYQLELTPKATGKVMLGMMRITTDCKIKKHQKQMAFFAIKAPKVKGKTSR